ncbi:MAG: hypothetical protein WCW27_00035 [Patescibacteria group bacterium]|jgi:hypothetical protein
MRLKLKQSVWLYSIATVTVGWFFGLLQWQANMPDPDSFYHARISALMAEQGLLYQFPWLHNTMLAQQFTDQHLLYHVLVIPLLQWFEPIVALKIIQVILLVLVVNVLLLILKTLLPKLNNSVLLALVPLLGISPFLIRLTLLKATPLALLLFFLVLWLLLRSNYYWAMLASMIYVYAHGGFALALVLAFSLVLADTLARSIKAKRLSLGDPRPIWCTSTGIVLGLVLNPYFPGNLVFYWQQFVQIGLVNYQNVIEVGAEWYPFQLGDLVGAVSILLIGGVGAGVVLVREWSKYNVDKFNLGLLLLIGLFGIITLRSRRYVEYFVPILWLWCCYLVVPQLQAGLWRVRLAWLRVQLGKLYWPFIIYLSLASIFTWGRAVWIAQESLQRGFVLNNYAAASDYLAKNSQAGDLVFNAEWDDWPILFYHNTQNYYMIGLDATFMYLHDPGLYRRWREIGKGEIKTNLVQIINKEFGAKYVFIDRTNKRTHLFLAYLMRDPQVQCVFRDSTTEIYKLTPDL